MGPKCARILLVSALLAAGVAAWLAVGGAGSPPPLELNLSVVRDGDWATVRVENGSDCADESVHLLEAEWPFREWHPVQATLVAGEARVRADVDRALVAEIVVDGVKHRSPVEMLGRFHAAGAGLSDPDSTDPVFTFPQLACGVRAATGNLVLWLGLAGTEGAIVYNSSCRWDPCGFGQGWFGGPGELLLSVDPPCILRSDGSLVALRQEADGVYRSVGDDTPRCSGTWTRDSAGRFFFRSKTPTHVAEFVTDKPGDGRVLQPAWTQRLEDGCPFGPEIRWQREDSSESGSKSTVGVELDPAGAVVRIRSATGAVWSMEYLPDPPGVRLLSSVTAREVGHEEPAYAFRMEYDEDLRLVSVSDALNRRTDFVYDGQGRLTEVLRPDGHRWRIGYGEGEATTRIDGPQEYVRIYRFHPETGKCAIIEERGHERIRREFDVEGRVVLQRGPGDQEIRYSYFPDGSRKEAIRSGGMD